jgi:hypothetical protein
MSKQIIHCVTKTKLYICFSIKSHLQKDFRYITKITQSDIKIIELSVCQ